MTIIRTTDRAVRVASIVLRWLLAILFLVSSVAKLVAIDDFELYLFSYALLPLNLCYLIARLCIAVELGLAVLLALGWWRRWVNLACVLLLVFFSLFLCYAALIGRSDSCHCMGNLSDMSPAVSLLKNAILIGLLLLLGRWQRRVGQRTVARWVRWVVGIGVGLACLILPFALSVPDNWLYGEEDTVYDQELLEQTVAELGMTEGHSMVAFVTPGCRYCRWTREKIGSIQRRHHLPQERLLFLEPQDLEDGRFLRITYGQRPLVVLIDDGHPVGTYHYRNISEKRLSSFIGEGR